MPRKRYGHWGAAKPIASRVYNATLARWLVVKIELPGQSVSMTWTGNRDQASTMESYTAETLALSLKLLGDHGMMGWEAVYAEAEK